MDLTYKHLKAIATFQQICRLKLRARRTLHRTLDRVYRTLVSVSNNIGMCYHMKVLTADQYQHLMSLASTLLDQHCTMAEGVAHGLLSDAPARVAFLHYKCTQLVQKCGTATLFDTLSLFADSNELDLYIDPAHERMLQLLNTMFVPISVKPLHQTSHDLKVLKYPCYTESIILKLHGAELSVPLYGQTLVVRGYFKADPLNSGRMRGTLKVKLDRLTADAVKRHSRDTGLVHRYINQISLRDFIALDPAGLMNRLSADMATLAQYRSSPKSYVLTEFLSASPRKQHTLLTLLLLDGGLSEHVQAIISTVRARTPDRVNALYRTLHWSVQRAFDDHLDAVTLSPVQVNDEDLPLETRIQNMVAEPAVKRKAYEKLKEVQGSKDGNEKAARYLDGLLSIPFGVYRKERILCFIGQFRERLTRMQRQLDSRLRRRTSSSSSFDGTDTETDVETDAELETQERHTLNLLRAHNYQNETELAELVQKLPDAYVELRAEWQLFKKDRLDYLGYVQRTLDDCIYGQDEAKRNIASVIAQWINGDMTGVVFGFQGFPGTGKTTLAKKGVAQCLVDDNGTPRPFYFTKLGGARGGNFLLGHSYTYVGAQPGKLASYLQDGKIMNPILYFDELDKVSNTPEGDEIIRILTHLLDPEQNTQIEDNYFGVNMDLSKALIILSYNDRSIIDSILLDRIHEINFRQYNTVDKEAIAQRYILPNILRSHGFEEHALVFSPELVRYVIENYTCEAGVRDMKDKLTDLVREVNLRRIYNEDAFPLPFAVTTELVDDILKAKNKITVQEIPSKPQVGWVNGLYATTIGQGGITVIQVFNTPSEQKYSLELTGKLGDVMKESVMCAKTISWSMFTGKLREAMNHEWRENALHVHFPAAGTSKDGPSAGAAITTAIISFFSKLPVRNDVAMTGEIDLHGNVCPIGGLQCKIEGAVRAGVRLVLVPTKNYSELTNVPTESITVLPVDNISEVVRLCLIGADANTFNYPHAVDEAKLAQALSSIC